MDERKTSLATLSPVAAANLLAANTRNIIKKLNAGKTLTARELATLEGVAHGEQAKPRQVQPPERRGPNGLSRFVRLLMFCLSLAIRFRCGRRWRGHRSHERTAGTT